MSHGMVLLLTEVYENGNFSEGQTETQLGVNPDIPIALDIALG